MKSLKGRAAAFLEFIFIKIQLLNTEAKQKNSPSLVLSGPQILQKRQVAGTC